MGGRLRQVVERPEPLGLDGERAVALLEDALDGQAGGADEEPAVLLGEVRAKRIASALEREGEEPNALGVMVGDVTFERDLFVTSERNAEGETAMGNGATRSLERVAAAMGVLLRPMS